MTFSSGRALMLMGLILLAACSARPGPEALYPRPDARVAEATVVTVHAVTTRAAIPEMPYAFGADRAAEPSFVSYEISIPPGHVTGQIEWPDARSGGRPDPATDFVTLSQTTLDAAQFRQLLAQPGARGLYVHGYNTRFQEALYRLAQMTADVQIDGIPMLFSWPSEGSVGGYMADRDASDQSRMALTRLLIQLVETQRGDHLVTVLAHSMGARLTLEALANLDLMGRRDVLDRLKVVLAAPDVDIDLFREQMAVIGTMREPIIILSSSDDSALRISSRVAGGHSRLGLLDIHAAEVRSLAEETGVGIMDITAIPTDDPAHGRYVSLVSAAAPADLLNPFDGLRSVGAFVLDRVGTTFQSISTAIVD